MAYAPRLERQSTKQEMFSKNVKINDIAVPNVLKRKSHSEGFYFEMDYIRSLDCISFFNICTTKELERFVSKISELIRKEIFLSSHESFPEDVFLEKYNSVKRAIHSSECSSLFKNFEDKINQIFLNMPNEYIPVGICHGDLTLSNILIRKNDQNIFLIDFLDSFIESPLIDMVKIRQDTRHMWTVSSYGGSLDKSKFSILMKHMDKMFEEEFKKYDFYKYFYNSFQIMNFLRILPYVKNKDQALICENAIANVISEVEWI